MKNDLQPIAERQAGIEAIPMLPVSTANKECLHNWEHGYIGDLIIYCTKCNKEIDDVYDKNEVSYVTHTCKDGKLIPVK